MKTEYDVVVIGAGPAGSIAARTCAQAGLRVLLAEKRQEIGSPVRCAEAAGKDTVAEFIPLDPQWIAAEVDHFSLTSSVRDTIHFPPLESTLVLERKIFDRELAHSAAQAGAEVIVKARAAGFIKNGAGLEGVKLSGARPAAGGALQNRHRRRRDRSAEHALGGLEVESAVERLL